MVKFQHVRKVGWSGWEDEKWMRIAIGKGWVISTIDRNEKTRGLTNAGAKESGARIILFGPFFDHLKGWDRAKFLVKYAETVHSLAESLPSGQVVLIDSRCKTKLL